MKHLEKTRLVLETLLVAHDAVADSPEAFAGYEGTPENTQRLLQELWEVALANPELTTTEELLEEWQTSLFNPSELGEEPKTTKFGDLLDLLKTTFPKGRTNT